MAINYSIYPPNWLSEIRPRLLDRAGHKCEYCGVDEYAIRFKGGILPFRFTSYIDAVRFIEDAKSRNIKQQLAEFQEKDYLQYIFDRVYGDLKVCPSCEVETKWHHLKGRKCYSCQWCGHLLSPLSKTPLANTKISIHLWFFAILLFGNSKNGVSAKELERQLGVSYPTAFRIGKTLPDLITGSEMSIQKGMIPFGRIEIDPDTCSISVLQIAHLDHDETNHSVSDDRLAVMCSSCHLRYDAHEHSRRRRGNIQ
jgi:transposase-like protein